jgi:hypothetical protein
MAAEQRQMVRSQQGSRAADTLVATLRGVASTDSEPVRKRLAALAAAAAEMRRTLRVKIEDDQDLLTAWNVRARCALRCASRCAARACPRATRPRRLIAARRCARAHACPAPAPPPTRRRRSWSAPSS